MKSMKLDFSSPLVTAYGQHQRPPSSHQQPTHEPSSLAWGPDWREPGPKTLGCALVPHRTGTPLILTKDDFVANHQPPIIELYVTSTRESKKEAALEWTLSTFQRAWPGFTQENVSVHQVAAKSGVSELPHGLQEGLEGAWNRAQNDEIQKALRGAGQEGRNVVVTSFENYIEQERLSLEEMPSPWRRHYAQDFER